jgi:hypothetical protein
VPRSYHLTVILLLVQSIQIMARITRTSRVMILVFIGLCVFLSVPAYAAISPLSFTVNMSENVIVSTTGGAPTIAIDVGSVAHTATYTTGTGTNALTFTYTPTAGDVDLDGITLTSPITVPFGSSIKDTAGNDAALTFTAPNTSGIKINYPSLSMDFTNGTTGRYTLNGVPYTSLSAFLTDTSGSFTRASIGTYFDSAGVLQTAASSVPRFDFDPVTHVAKGMLIEEARVNSLPHSSRIDSDFSALDTSNPAYTTLITAPDGTSGAAFIDISSGVGTPRIFNVNLLNGVQTSSGYVFSVFLKAPTGQSGQVGLRGRDSAASFFDQLCLVTSLEWTRCSVVVPSNVATTSTSLVYIGNRAIAGSTLYTFYAWGAQVEQGKFITSYIPTTTAAVSRAADNLIISTGSWYNNSIGTYFADVQGASMSSTFGGIIGSNSNSQQSLFGQNTSVFVGANPFASGSRVAGASFKAAYSYQSSGLNLSVNGGSINAGGAQNPNSPSSIEILGYWQGQKTTGLIKKVKYYPSVVSNAQLQFLTQ